MGRPFAALLLISLLCATGYGQGATPQPPNTPPNPADSSSKQAQPPSPPTSPDVVMPDPSAVPVPSDKKQSPVKRKLKELEPHCLDVQWAFHTCWSSPDAPPAKAGEPAVVDPEFAKDMDVGDFYLQKKNYAGAMFRFKDALERKPNDPLATFKLAQSLEGLHRADEARQNYTAYLALEPKGSLVDQAQKALKRLQATNADKAK